MGLRIAHFLARSLGGGKFIMPKAKKDLIPLVAAFLIQITYDSTTHLPLARPT
jgi:hypothetical protein